MQSYMIGYLNNEKLKLKLKEKLIYKVRDFKDFSSLTDERNEELKEDAQKLYERFINGEKIGKNYYKIISYLTSFDHSEEKYTPEELLSVIIQTIDPNLYMFKIDYRISNKYEVEKAICSKFGFYEPILIDFERLYAIRFKNKRKNINLSKKTE